MRVDKERLDANFDQVIQRERDERLLKNWNQRFGQIIGQWTQACTKSGAEYESRGELLSGPSPVATESPDPQTARSSIAP